MAWFHLEGRAMADVTTKPATKRIALNARGLERMREVAEFRGLTVREYMERLMHYAISTYERPGSWEAQGFDPAAYAEDGYADRWF
jgi:hypothetical protein